MKIEHIQPAGIEKVQSYTHVVTATGGKTVWISGQVAKDVDGNVVGKGDLNAQVAQVYENLTLALVAAGATFRNVVKVNIYVVNYEPSMLAGIREIRSRYTGPENPQPATTLVGV